MKYHVQIADEAKDLETKIRWLIELRVPGIDSETHIVETSEKDARIELNTGDLSEDQIQALQLIVKRDVSEFVPEAGEIKFGPEEPPESEPPEEGGTEGSDDEAGPPEEAQKEAESLQEPDS
jgi:hypothetical protein